MKVKPSWILKVLAIAMLPKILVRRAVANILNRLPPRLRCWLGLHPWKEHKHKTGFARRKCIYCHLMQEGRWYPKAWRGHIRFRTV